MKTEIYVCYHTLVWSMMNLPVKPLIEAERHTGKQKQDFPNEKSC